MAVEGDPGRTVGADPAGTSRGTKRLGLEASTSLSGLASLCLRKLCKWMHTNKQSYRVEHKFYSILFNCCVNRDI